MVWCRVRGVDTRGRFRLDNDSRYSFAAYKHITYIIICTFTRTKLYAYRNVLSLFLILIIIFQTKPFLKPLTRQYNIPAQTPPSNSSARLGGDKLQELCNLVLSISRKLCRYRPLNNNVSECLRTQLHVTVSQYLDVRV